MNKQKTFLITATILLATLILSGCTSEVQDIFTKAEDVMAAEDATEASNLFAIDLYGDLAQEEGNVFFSPFSISSVMTMIYEGSKNETASQLETALYLPRDIEEVREDYRVLYRSLNQDDNEYELSTANALWLQEEYEVLQEYLNVINDYYNGEAQNLDFINEPERSRKVINNWVEDQTNGQIEDLLPPGTVNEDTKLVLTNAIYFLGEWITQFNPDQTYPADFTLQDGSTVKADMMNRSDEKAIFDYYEDDDVQVLKMPYSGRDVSMVMILPWEEDIQALENDLYVRKIDKWLEKSENQRVNVTMPKFMFESKYDMKQTLADLGIVDLFNFRADLSGITEVENLFVSDVIHQANIKVDESGTEAAAATGGVITPTSINPDEEPIPNFRADHPFIFIILHEDSGNYLFMGRVSDPTE